MKKILFILISLFIIVFVFLGLSTDSLALTSTEQAYLDNAPNYQDFPRLVDRTATYKVLIKYYQNLSYSKVFYYYVESESPINFNIKFSSSNIEIFAYSASSSLKSTNQLITAQGVPNATIYDGRYVDTYDTYRKIPSGFYYAYQGLSFPISQSPYTLSDIITIFNYAPGSTVYNWNDLSVIDTFPPPVSMTGISIQTLPTTLEYYENDVVSMDGAVVVANYSDDTFETITDYTISPTTVTGLGSQTITLSYEGFSTTFEVTVYENQGSSLLGKILNFFLNFWDKLLHFFIPTDNQIDELKASFSTNILSKFNISSWSFDSNDLEYPTWNTGSVFQNAPIEPPVLQIPILGTVVEYDTQTIVDFLDMPLSFGKAVSTHPGSDVDYFESVPTGGLTVRVLISSLLSLEFFVANIYLYNKFLSKGGD